MTTNTIEEKPGALRYLERTVTIIDTVHGKVTRTERVLQQHWVVKTWGGTAEGGYINEWRDVPLVKDAGLQVEKTAT